MVLFSKKANIAPQKSLVERQKFTIIHPVHYGRGLARILLATGLIILILASIPIASNPIASLPAIYGATQLSDAHGPMPQETARPGCTELIINGDFELLGPEWEIERGPRPPLHVSDVTHNNSSKAIQLGIVDISNVESTSFIKQTVNLPKDAESITLTFYYNTRRDSERDSGDVQFVEIFNNLTGTFLTRVLTEQSDTRDWVVRQRDLMPYSGQQISVYFVVENDGGKNSVAMNIDDVSIVACKPVVPPTETPTATNVPTLTAVPTVVVVPTSRDTSVATLTPVPTIIPAVTSALPIGGSNECQNYLINGDFETGAANFGHPNFGYSTGWQRGRDPIPAELSSTEKYGGNYAVLLGHSPDNRHGDRQTYSSIRQLVTVPQYVASMELRWRHRSNSQEAVDNQPHRSNDRADVIFLDQNLKPIEVIHRQRDNSNTWKIATVPINTAKYSGRSFYVYFNVYNDGGGGRTWSYVDNVELIGCRAGATLAQPVANVAPTSRAVAAKPEATSKPAFTKEPTQTFVGPLKPQNNVAPVQNTSESADDASTLRSTEAEPIPEYSITPIQPAKGLQEPTTLPSYATEPESSLLDTLGLGGSDDPQPTSSFRWLRTAVSCLLGLVVVGLLLFLARAIFSGRRLPFIGRQSE